VNCEKKRLNRSRCHLEYGLEWAQGSMYSMGSRSSLDSEVAILREEVAGPRHVQRSI